MLLADLQKIPGVDDNALEVISCGLNRDFVKEHRRGGRGVAQLAGETCRLLDQFTCAREIARQPHRKREESSGGCSDVKAELFSDFAAGLLETTTRQFELGSRLAQVAQLQAGLAKR